MSVLPVPISAMQATELASLSRATAPAIATSWAAKGLRSSFPRIGETGSPGACKAGKLVKMRSPISTENSRKYSSSVVIAMGLPPMVEVDPRRGPPGLRCRDLDLAELQTGPDPVKELGLGAPDGDWLAI